MSPFPQKVFAEWAPGYAEQGLVPIPVGGRNGKVPLIKEWQHTTLQHLDSLIDRFPDANIGLLDGTPNGITRIDIDNPDLIEYAIQRFGDTPLKAITANGGRHLYYASQGERRRQRISGLAIDMLGKGGFGVAPPSRCPSTGSYIFIEGSVEDIPRLPPINPGALDQEEPSFRLDDRVREGERNNWLFNQLLQVASHKDTESELRFYAECLNEKCSPPLPNAEVEKTVGSVWQYKLKGKLFGGEQTATVPKSAISVLSGESVALHLYVWLRQHHYGLRNTFVIDQQKVGSSIGFSEKTIRRAIRVLCEHSLLKRVHTGRGKGDPHKYEFL